MASLLSLTSCQTYWEKDWLTGRLGSSSPCWSYVRGSARQRNTGGKQIRKNLNERKKLWRHLACQASSPGEWRKYMSAVISDDVTAIPRGGRGRRGSFPQQQLIGKLFFYKLWRELLSVVDFIWIRQCWFLSIYHKNLKSSVLYMKPYISSWGLLGISEHVSVLIWVQKNVVPEWFLPYCLKTM